MKKLQELGKYFSGAENIYAAQVIEEAVIREQSLREALKEASDILEIVAEDTPDSRQRTILSLICEKNRLL